MADEHTLLFIYFNDKNIYFIEINLHIYQNR